MSCRSQVRRRAEVAPAGALEPAVERPKRIDAYIDYFASGDRRRPGIVSDPDADAMHDGDAR